MADTDNPLKAAPILSGHGEAMKYYWLAMADRTQTDESKARVLSELLTSRESADAALQAARRVHSGARLYRWVSE